MSNVVFSEFKATGTKDDILELGKKFICRPTDNIDFNEYLLDHPISILPIAHRKDFLNTLEKAKNLVLNTPNFTSTQISFEQFIPIDKNCLVDLDNCKIPIGYKKSDLVQDKRDWMLSNWGCASDIISNDLNYLRKLLSDIEEKNPIKASIDFSFKTAYEDSTTAMKEISKQFPKVAITCSFVDESGRYYKECTYKNGKEKVLIDTPDKCRWLAYNKQDLDTVLDTITYNYSEDVLDELLNNEAKIKRLARSLSMSYDKEYINSYFEDVINAEESPKKLDIYTKIYDNLMVK